MIVPLSSLISSNYTHIETACYTHSHPNTYSHPDKAVF
jgi:hypothetical protein